MKNSILVKVFGNYKPVIFIKELLNSSSKEPALLTRFYRRIKLRKITYVQYLDYYFKKNLLIQERDETGKDIILYINKQSKYFKNFHEHVKPVFVPSNADFVMRIPRIEILSVMFKYPRRWIPVNVVARLSGYSVNRTRNHLNLLTREDLLVIKEKKDKSRLDGRGRPKKLYKINTKNPEILIFLGDLFTKNIPSWQPVDLDEYLERLKYLIKEQGSAITRDILKKKLKKSQIKSKNKSNKF